MSSTTHFKTAPEDRISLKQKSAYAVGMLVNNLQAAALPAMVVILNLGLGMDVLWVGLIGAIPRIFDAISDPMLGYISDNTRTRWGRRRPFIFAGALIAGLIFALMWQLPSGYIDILAKTPVKAHQLVSPEVREAEMNNAGGITITSDTGESFAAAVSLYGPERNKSGKGLTTTDLDGFPQVELNVAIPEFESFMVVFNESADGSDMTGGESYVIELDQSMSEGGKGNLYKFQLSDLQQNTELGLQQGNQQLDLKAIDNITIYLSGLTTAEGATIHSLKLRKSQAFFVKYFWYFMAMSILFFLSYTVFATPFVAFGYEMTPDYHERTRLHAFANTVGQLAWLGVPWFYAIMSSALFRDTVHGARTLAIAVGIIVAVFGIIPAIFLKERPIPEPVKQEKKGFAQNMTEFFKGIVTTFKCKPFVKLCGATFLVFNGFQLGMSFSIYVMIYYLFGGNDGDAGQLMGWFGMLTSIATLGVIPLTGWIATRIGKRKTFLITISLSLFGYAMKWIGYNPDYPYWLLYAAPFVAFGTGSLFTLMGSMISDVCDYDELETHQRREGVFGAIYWWMVKVGMALAGLLTGVLLKSSGFDVALGAAQGEETLFLIRLFDVGIPMLTSAIALWIIASYTLTEKRANEIRTELEFRRGKIVAADSIEN
ncbi:MAG: MFS transporter [Candidatus Marinimicrobia bacterium]|nr:MFS transporter [Candidatus Neomarinimicrobiota bacterium]MCF7850386.1 MFS transporter [Candidatus Neomarinimicrobiota bacterium]MCF7904646.1 MFS transporter [Candidatus Neomarinimicrobiota bacterium]